MDAKQFVARVRAKIQTNDGYELFDVEIDGRMANYLREMNDTILLSYLKEILAINDVGLRSLLHAIVSEIQKQSPECIEAYNNACHFGYTTASYRLAQIYRNGRIVPKDDKKRLLNELMYHTEVLGDGNTFVLTMNADDFRIVQEIAKERLALDAEKMVKKGDTKVAKYLLDCCHILTPPSYKNDDASESLKKCAHVIGYDSHLSGNVLIDGMRILSDTYEKMASCIQEDQTRAKTAPKHKRKTMKSRY